MKYFKLQRQYYYLVAGLQDISLDISKLQFHLSEFKNEMLSHLHPEDYKLVEKLFLPYDNNNLLNFLEKNEGAFDSRGNYTLEDFEENLKEASTLPEYMLIFMKAFVEKEKIFDLLSDENELSTLFYDYILKEDNVFLCEWFIFNRNVRNITTALICRKYNINYENQIIGNDEISDIIRKSQARDFGLSGELPYIDDLINISRLDSVTEREKAIDLLKWKYLDEVTFFEYFTIEKILAFVIKTSLIERWLAIDKDYGNEMFKKLLTELENTYKLSKKNTEQ